MLKKGLGFGLGLGIGVGVVQLFCMHMFSKMVDIAFEDSEDEKSESQEKTEEND